MRYDELRLDLAIEGFVRQMQRYTYLLPGSERDLAEVLADLVLSGLEKGVSIDEVVASITDALEMENRKLEEKRRKR